MTLLLLIRHARTGAVGEGISGRTPNVPLSLEGRDQAEALAARLRPLSLAAVYSSPLQRARETALLITAGRGLEVRISPALNEVDFGEWTGRNFRELEPLPEWRRFNRLRSDTRIPGGEMMAEVQARAVVELHRVSREHLGETMAVVSHGDVIRGALCHYLGLSLDLGLRLEIDPGSVSAVALEDGGPRVLRVNDTGDLGPGNGQGRPRAGADGSMNPDSRRQT